jgi:hypothetical protein
VLAATAVSLDDMMRRSMFYNTELTFDIEYGRGLIVAFVAVGLFAAALLRTPPGPAGVAAEERRRRIRRRSDEPQPDGERPPADITVTPTVPFAREAPPD